MSNSEVITLHNGQQVINPSKKLKKQVHNELVWLSNLVNKRNKHFRKHKK